MSMTDTLETAILELLAKNTTFAGVGDATGIVGSTVAGSLYVSLHTADPGEGGDQSTSEAAYTNYARVAVVRSGSGWTVVGNALTNAALISWPQGGASGAAVATHVGVGTALSGAGKLLLKGALSPTISMGNGVTPQVQAGQLSVTLN